jgi:hypothetical protein
VRERGLRVFHHGAFEEFRRALETLVRALLQWLERLLAQVSRGQILGRRPARRARVREMRPQPRDQGVSDLVLPANVSTDDTSMDSEQS